jgi:hypothetical protein
VTILDAFEDLFSQSEPAFSQTRVMLRARDLAFGIINCVGRRTVTGMLTSCGKLFEDWSADYRIFQQNRMDVAKMFSVVRKELVVQLSDQQPIYAHMDDTLLRKTGKKVEGTAWRRDPLGPPFHTNFIWGQRFIQLSVSLPEHQGPSAARSIPVDLFHAPTVKKPNKTAEQDLWQQYKEKQKQARLSKQGVERIKVLRDNLDSDGVANRQLVVSVDGSYSNETVLKNLPDRTTLIGRIRKDTSLNELPKTSNGAGRNRVYGDQLPTPEQVRQSKEYPWQSIVAYAAGKKHNFNVKVVRNVRWRKAGKQNLQLVVIRPLSYRLTKNSKLLYRKPAYLICTDPNMEIDKLLQAYLWRWGIEVNFREEKTVLGCGQAQVRTQSAVEKVPAFIAVVYAMLQLAAHKVDKVISINRMPRAKWYPKKRIERLTTGDIINNLKSQLWAKSLDINFNHFVNIHTKMRNTKNRPQPTQAAFLYCRK